MLFAESSTKKPVFVISVLLIQLFASTALLVYLTGLIAAVSLGAILLSFIWYYAMSKKHFGGITGDLAGFFVCIAELAGLIVLPFIIY